ncbi:hypothetical protein M3226_15290 [Neobacillus cucumis]|nr:hypothetical protein [Neobacillus cucumis]MCM3727048.1 hypothetical protein [Neobacillus cucumis]
MVPLAVNATNKEWRGSLLFIPSILAFCNKASGFT